MCIRDSIKRILLVAIDSALSVEGLARTSVSLENAFWTDLKGFAANRRITVNQLITEIDRERTGNLSSAIRIYVLKQYHKPATIL